MRADDFSGYHSCPCRDCFEIAIGATELGRPALCGDCSESGCVPEYEGGGECDAPGAYGGESDCDYCDRGES